jgi:type II secretory pathway component PulF
LKPIQFLKTGEWMLNKLKVYFAKRDFMARRGEIYELLYSNLSESGSGKVATIRELFDAWAVRENKRGNSIALVFRSIVAKLEAGHTFSGAIGPFIPAEEGWIMDAGEASGRLVEALKSAHIQCRSGNEIKSIVAAAVAEPAMSVLSISLTAWFCGTSLWPEVLKVVDLQFWPAWATPLVKFEIAFAQHWQIMAVIAFLAWLYIWSMPRWTGRVRSVFDAVPPWSIYRDRQSAAFLGVLGGLLSSGMELDAAMARIEKASDPWLQWHIQKIRVRLSATGANPLKALDDGLFSAAIMDFIEDASRTRSFDAAITHLGTDAMPLIIRKVKTMAAVAGTVLTLLTGLVFLYQVAVQQSGVTQATNNFTRSAMK